MSLITIRKNDWLSVRDNFLRVKKLLLGSDSSPTFKNVTISTLTPETIILADQDKKLVSLSDGEVGQLLVTDGEGTLEWQWMVIDGGNANGSGSRQGFDGGTSEAHSSSGGADCGGAWG